MEKNPSVAHLSIFKSFACVYMPDQKRQIQMIRVENIFSWIILKLQMLKVMRKGKIIIRRKFKFNKEKHETRVLEKVT